MPGRILRTVFSLRGLATLLLIAALAWAGNLYLNPGPRSVDFDRVLNVPGPTSQLQRRSNLVLQLGWTSNNETVIARQEDGRVIAWDVATGQGDPVARTQAVFEYCAAMSRLLINIEDQVVLLGLADGSSQKLTLGSQDYAAFSADCSTVAMARENENKVRIWRGDDDWIEVETEQPVRNSLMLSRDGNFVATAGGTYSEEQGHETVLEVFEIGPAATQRTAKVSNPDEVLGMWSMAFTADGSGLMIGSQMLGQSGLRHIDSQSGDVLWGHDGFESYWIRALAASPNGILLATGDESGMLRIWDVQSGVLVAQFSTGQVIQSMAFSHDGGKLAVGLWDGTIGIANADALIVR